MPYKIVTFSVGFEPPCPDFCLCPRLHQRPDHRKPVGEIRQAGFDIHARRVVSETVSGSMAAAQREGSLGLLDRMEEGDILVVTKMDRLGRNSMDVRTTVELLAGMGVKVHCLALGGVDLTSSTGA